MEALALHSAGLKHAIAPNVGNSGAQFLVVGDCVRASPFFIMTYKIIKIIIENESTMLNPHRSYEPSEGSDCFTQDYKCLLIILGFINHNKRIISSQHQLPAIQ